MDPTDRLWIPNQNTSEIIDTVNKEILPWNRELHGPIYCTTYIIAITNAVNTNDQNQNNWAYTNPEKKTHEKVEIKRAEERKRSSTNTGDPRQGIHKISHLLIASTPSSKKLAALTTRISRYSKCNKRRERNKDFKINEGKFYRVLNGNGNCQDRMN